MAITLHEARDVVLYRREGDGSGTPLHPATRAEAAAYSNATPGAGFTGATMREALDELFRRLPPAPVENGEFVSSQATGLPPLSFVVPKGVRELLVLMICPGGAGRTNADTAGQGGMAVAFRMPATPGDVLPITLQRAIPTSSTASSLRLGSASDASPHAIVRTKNANPSWKVTFPGCEVLFAKGAGTGGGGSYSNRGGYGGSFNIRDEDLLHFALNGATYGLPTNGTSATKTAQGAHGKDVYGPSGANTTQNQFGSGDGLVLRYGGGASGAKTGYTGCGYLLKIWWGPQIRP